MEECIAALQREIETLRRAIAMLTLGTSDPDKNSRRATGDRSLNASAEKGGGSTNRKRRPH
jgi:hypothetical protein